MVSLGSEVLDVCTGGLAYARRPLPARFPDLAGRAKFLTDAER